MHMKMLSIEQPTFKFFILMHYSRLSHFLSQKREWFYIKLSLVNHIWLDVPEISYPMNDD